MKTLAASLLITLSSLAFGAGDPGLGQKADLPFCECKTCQQNKQCLPFPDGQRAPKADLRNPASKKGEQRKTGDRQ
jgi:hypothetical protein